MSEPFWAPLAAMPTAGGGLPKVGDFKLSLQAASHADPSGTGTWYLGDGSAIPGYETQLIALAGANLPDVLGRAPVAKGTHADVNAFGKNDGVAVSGRSPIHKQTVNEVAHTHGNTMATNTGGNVHTPAPGGAASGTNGAGIIGSTTNLTVGPTASSMIDKGAFCVAGNPFYYGSGS